MTAFGAAARVIGEVGGDALSIEGALNVPLVDLDRAFTRGLVRPPGNKSRRDRRRRGHEPSSADATLLTRGRDPYVIAAALLLDEILAGELDVESGCVEGEPIADWIDRFSRIAPPRIIAELVRQGLRDAAPLLTLGRCAGRGGGPIARRTRRDPRHAAGDQPASAQHPHAAAGGAGRPFGHSRFSYGLLLDRVPPEVVVRPDEGGLVRGKKVLAPLALGVAMAVAAGPAQAQVAQPAGAIKNMELVGNLPEAANSTAINFMTYGKKDKGKGAGRVDLGLVRLPGQGQGPRQGQPGPGQGPRQGQGQRRHVRHGPLRPEDVRHVRPGEAEAPRRDHQRSSCGCPAIRRTRPRTRRRRSGRTRTWTSIRSASSRCLSRDPRAYRGSTTRDRAIRTRTAPPTSPASTSSTPRTRPI